MAARKRDDRLPRSLRSETSSGSVQDSPPLHWHIAIAGNAHGPYTLRQMLAFRAADRLAPDTFVHLEGWPEWRRVGELPELNPAAKTWRSRVPLLTRPEIGPRATLASRDDVASQRPLGAPPPLQVAMGHDPFALPELEDDPSPPPRRAATARSSFDALGTASWDLDAMPPLESLAASSRIRARGPAQHTVAASSRAPGRSASRSRKVAARGATPARAPRAALADRWRAGWSEAVRRARSVLQRMRVPERARRTWQEASSRVQAVVRRVTAPRGMTDVAVQAMRRLQAAVPARAIASLVRGTCARALRDTHALVQRMRALGEADHPWRRAMRRVASLRFAGARVGTVATILLAGLLAGAASFVGANVLDSPGSRLAHSTPRRTPANARAAGSPSSLACMPAAAHPAASEAVAPVTAMCSAHAAEVRESNAQSIAPRRLRSTRSAVAHSRRPRGAAPASRKGTSQVSSQAQLVAGRSLRSVATQDRALH